MIKLAFILSLIVLADATAALAQPKQPDRPTAKESFMCEGMSISLGHDQPILVPEDPHQQSRLRQCLESFRDQLTIRAEISKTLEQIAASQSSLAKNERERTAADQAAKAGADEGARQQGLNGPPAGMTPGLSQPPKPLPLSPQDAPRILSVLGARGQFEALLQLPDGSESTVKPGSVLADGSKIQRIAAGTVIILPPGGEPFPLAFALPDGRRQAGQGAR